MVVFNSKQLNSDKLHCWGLKKRAVSALSPWISRQDITLEKKSLKNL